MHACSTMGRAINTGRNIASKGGLNTVSTGAASPQVSRVVPACLVHCAMQACLVQLFADLHTRLLAVLEYKPDQAEAVQGSMLSICCAQQLGPVLLSSAQTLTAL